MTMNDKTLTENVEQITSSESDLTRPLRQIKSFVLRQGRLTKGQERALSEHWSSAGIDYQADRQLKMTDLFGRSAPTTLEIGFGMGASLVTMAEQSPERNFIGIEVHLPGVGACLMAMAQQDITNLRVINHDAVEVLENMIPDNSLDTVQIFFPDPWHKARHNKRRIIQAPFVQLLRKKLSIDGILHLATDWQDYAEHMLSVLSNAEGLQNLSLQGNYIPRPDSRPETKFEKRGKNLGHGVWDLQFKKVC